MEMVGNTENGKRRRGASQHDDRDGISKLPNEILISIISRLTLREGIATRVLSTRWRYLCTNEYATHLNFPPFNLSNCDGDASKSLNNILIRRRFENYISMINQIVDSHKGLKVNEFRVRMHSLMGATIQKWLVFALSKQVEIVDIHMDYYSTNKRRIRRVSYSFHLRNLIMQLPLGLGSLKKLSLSSIVVEDSEIELLLSHSPQLESLSIAWPRRLSKVSVVGQPTFMLKHLEIRHSSHFQLLEIGNMINLVSLKLHDLGNKFVLALNNVPKLVEYNTSDDYVCTFHNVFSRVAPSIRDQLHTLKIYSSGMHPTFRGTIPEFTSVKHLELQNEPLCVLYHWLRRFLAVMQRCPSLEELVIKLSWPVDSDNDLPETAARTLRWPPKGDLFPSLKKMKFSGFGGSSAESNFFISILNNANSLEDLAVEVCDDAEEIRLLATHLALQHNRPTITRLQVI